MKKILNIIVLLCGLAVISASAQYASPPSTAAYEPLGAQQMDQLLGPIALYPDPLTAQILPAATLPTQIVLADRYVEGGGDPNQIDQQPWDASVQAVARYPSVLKWLDDNLNWTTQLGNAFLNQQQDVMDSIQRLRAEAQNLGNLQNTPQQQVVTDNGDIEILPADPQMIYVPQYTPATVYYQSGFGAPFITFGLGFAIGGWLNCDFDWHGRRFVTWDHDHPRPDNWWHERPDQRAVVIARQTTVWRPENHRDAGTVYRGDRGYERQSPAPVRINRPDQSPPAHAGGNYVAPSSDRQEQVQRPPAEIQRPVESDQVNRPAPGGAFIGIQSAHDTHTFSNRGQESRQITTAPRSSGGGGGGGGHEGQKH